MKDRFKLEEEFQKLPELFDRGKRKVIRDKICNDEEDKESVDKMFYHYSPSKQKMVKSDPIVKYDGRHYIVIVSEMANRRSQDLYHGAWVIGIDPSQHSGFFIHRLQHDERFEDSEFNWTKETVKEFMGFDQHYQSQEIKANFQYRVQGDIMFKWDVENVRNEYSGKIDRLIKDCIRKTNIETIDDQSESKDIIEKIEDAKIIKDNLPRQLNFQMGNHLFMVDGVLTHKESRWKNRCRFYVTEDSKMVVVHDEHYNQTVDLKPGLYKVSFMRRHQEN